MDKLVLFSQDKETLNQVRDYLNSTLEKRLIKKALNGQEVTGFKDASEIIKTAFDEIELLSKKDKKLKNLNQSE